MPSRPRPPSARPGRSSRPAGPCDSARRRWASGASAIPIGTLSQKIHCHEMPSTMAPPTSGPSATPSPEMPDQAPIARPRLAGRERGREQRERERRHDRGAGALQRAGGDQGVGRRGQGGERGGDGEDPDADDEHAPAAEAVAERGAGEQQDRERQRVGVDGPFERLQPSAQVRADRRQGGRDDEVVEHDHEERDRDDRERPQRAGASHKVSVYSLPIGRQERERAKLVVTHLRPEGARR